MADINYNDYGVAAALGQLAQAQEAMAMRPQKTSTFTTTTSTSTPRALEDMIARRNMIGVNNQNLIDAMKPRESFLYRFGQGLANVTPQNESGAGWLSGFLRGVGSGLTGGTDARIAREQMAQELARKDLETALAYDKEMGETQKQTQNQTVGYTEMPYAGGKGGAQGSNQQLPMTTAPDFDYWIKNWDKDRTTESAYRNQTGVGRKVSNSLVGGMWGADTTASENAARQDMNQVFGQNFLPMARNILKGSGPITDFEDRKYTAWINDVKDPVQLKDTMVRIVKDVATKNGWTDEQLALGLNALGVQSDEDQLLPSQVEQMPQRVKGWYPGWQPSKKEQSTPSKKSKYQVQIID